MSCLAAASTEFPVDLPVVDNAGDDALLALLPPVAVDEAELVAAAGRAGRLLAPAVHDALVEFADQGSDAGALLVRNLPTGRIGPTPSAPQGMVYKDQVSELVLLASARRLGQPVGYAPEHGGEVVQNLLPTADDVTRQTSTSSGVELAFHTETAFHPHKPRYLLLLCLRGEPAARTLLTSIRQVARFIPAPMRQVLREPRFATSADESFRDLGAGTRPDDPAPRPWVSPPVPVLSGPDDALTFTFDADLMEGLDPEAAAALEQLRQLVRDHHVGVALEAGDLLVIDNAVAVHGRSSFPARFDGTDRWLQRTFVVPDLTASADERRGRVILTRFA
jgi:L-asparagine oxygenase